MWVLQQNQRNQVLLGRIKDALDRLDRAWCEVPLIPFTAEIPTLPFDPEREPVLCYGASFVPRVAQYTAWRPGIYFDEAAFRWSAMQRHWHDLMLSRDGELLPLVAALDRLDETAGEAFVRPDADSKRFDGGVYRRAGLASLFADAPPAAIELAEHAAARWMPAPVACIDIGRSGERFGVIEANCFSASGFYAADLEATLAAVTSFAYAAG